MEVLCARYQLRAVGCSMKSRVAATPGVRGRPERPKASADASHTSRSRASFNARHQGLPGVGADTGFSSPRRSCHRMKAEAARR